MGRNYMEMSGQKLILEPRETVWKALNDPEILRNCVPGCQSLEKTSDSEMIATATLRVGPVSAKFGGKISLSELNAPISYRITGEGQGGVAGFAKGTAFITLDEAEGGTTLSYSVEAQVGGKLAQLGGRLIDATARKMSEAFFEKFASEIRRQYHAAGDTAVAPQPAAGMAPAPPATGVYPSPHGSGPPPPETAGRACIATLAALALAAVFAFLWLAGRQNVAPPLTVPALSSPEFGSAVQLILIAAVGYLFGRLSDRRR
jgi:uncharacterized protein